MIGANIKAARLAAGLTQKQLAKKINVPYQHVQKWEYGQIKPGMDSLAKLCSALSKTADELTGG